MFKSNTTDNFRVHLAHPLNLEGSWEVALVECSYPRTFYNVPLTSYFEYRMISFDDKIPANKIYSEVRRILIKGGYYSAASQLIQELKYEAHQLKGVDISFIYNSSLRKLSLIGSKNVEIRLSDRLAYVCGWEPSVWHTAASVPRGCLDLTGGRYHLYIYVDIINYQLVGDAHAPLLRTVKITGEWGETQSINYNAPHYLSVSKSFIDTIAVTVRADTGERMDFLYGKVLIKLHFRKKPSPTLLSP